ncbi:MAG: hypothetical protein Fur0042_16660 [Cyanophyceae cyanobacterium]
MGERLRSRWSRTVAGGTMLLGLGWGLLRPWSAGFDGDYLRRVEQRSPGPWPSLMGSNWLDRSPYQVMEKALADRLPFRGAAIQLRSQLELLGRDRFDRVDVGRDRWLYYRLSYGLEETADSDRYTAERVDRAIARLDRFLAWQGRRHPAVTVRLAIVPSKHTIYPEYLPPLARRDLARTAAARDRLYRAVGDRAGSDPRILELWSVYRAGKATIPDRLFLPLDTHHSSRGAHLLIEALWRSLDPAIAATAQIQPILNRHDGGGDLRLMLGIRKRFTPWQVLPDTRDRVFQLTRPAIEAQGIWINGDHYPSAQAARDRGALDGQYVAAIARHRSRGTPILAGRTLILRDSFLDAKTWDSLTPAFTEVHLHHIQPPHAPPLDRAFVEYDQIILQVAERHALRLLERLPTDP